MSFALYMVGFLIFLAGLAWGASVAGVPTIYIGIGAMILLGIGIISGASRTRINRGAGDVTVVRDNEDL